MHSDPLLEQRWVLLGASELGPVPSTPSHFSPGLTPCMFAANADSLSPDSLDHSNIPYLPSQGIAYPVGHQLQKHRRLISHLYPPGRCVLGACTYHSCLIHRFVMNIVRATFGASIHSLVNVSTCCASFVLLLSSIICHLLSLCLTSITFSETILAPFHTMRLFISTCSLSDPLHVETCMHA